MYETKIKNVYENFSYHKETFDFINYLTNSKYYNSNKLVIGKMKAVMLRLKNLSD